MAQSLPVCRSTSRTSTPGKTLPTVVARSSGGSSVLLWVMPGEASVRPYTLVISWACIRDITCFMVSMGQGDPAMIPVRSEVRSNIGNMGWGARR